MQELAGLQLNTQSFTRPAKKAPTAFQALASHMSWEALWQYNLYFKHTQILDIAPNSKVFPIKKNIT